MVSKKEIERYSSTAEGRLLLRRLYDLSERADTTGAVVASGFLTPAERAMILPAARHFPVEPLFCGGFEGAERTAALFGFEIPEFGSAHPIAAIEISHKVPLGHRDLLGAALGLGLERVVLGDIAAGERVSRMVILRSSLPFLLTHFDRAGRVPVEVNELELQRFEPPERSFELRTVTVASARLDAVVAAAWKLSREDARRAVEAGLVRKNHVEATNPSGGVSEGDLLAFKGKGRLEIELLGGVTRRGRVKVVVKGYV